MSYISSQWGKCQPSNPSAVSLPYTVSSPDRYTAGLLDGARTKAFCLASGRPAADLSLLIINYLTLKTLPLHIRNRNHPRRDELLPECIQQQRVFVSAQGAHTYAHPPSPAGVTHNVITTGFTGGRNRLEVEGTFKEVERHPDTRMRVRGKVFLTLLVRN